MHLDDVGPFVSSRCTRDISLVFLKSGFILYSCSLGHSNLLSESIV